KDRLLTALKPSKETVSASTASRNSLGWCPMRMMISSLCRRAVGDGTVGPAAGFPCAPGDQTVDAGLNVVLPDPCKAIGEGQHDGDEQRAEAEQPELGE